MLERLRLIDGVSNVSLQSSTKTPASSGSGGGACAAGAPQFTANVSFEPLPAPAVTQAAVTAEAALTSSQSPSGGGK